MKKTILLSGFVFFGMMFSASINAQTSFMDDFSAGIMGSGWQANSMHKLTQGSGILTVKVGKTQKNAFFTLDLGSNIDISSNAVVNLKLRAQSTPYILRLTLVDASNATSSKDVRVPVAASALVNYCFDFTSVTGINKAQIRKVQFYFNPDATGYGGTANFDDLQIGTTATKFANLSPVGDVIVYKGKTAQKILVTDILNTSAIAVTGGGAIIQNVTYSTITGGACTISYDCLATGTDVITVTATGSGVGNNSTIFNLTVEDNIAPLVDKPADIKVPVGTAVPVKITGISDGNESVEQILTVTATSGTPAVVPNPAVVYSMQGSPYATLTVNAATAGTATIDLKVEDDGTPTLSTTKQFTVTSYDGFNFAPAINIPMGQSMYQGTGDLKVKLTGISDGDAAVQILTIIAAGKNGVISGAPVTYTQGQDTAIVTLTAASLGKDTITVTVADDGDNGTNNGDQSVQITFTVDVLQPAPKGWAITMNNFIADTTAHLWKIEGQGVDEFAGYVDTLGERCMRFIINNKGNWTGTWFNFPKELNLTNAPYVSYKIMATNLVSTSDKGVVTNTKVLQTHAYFWDVNGKRNNINAGFIERDTILTADTGFTPVFLDFRKPNYLNDETGNPIVISRVSQLLLNYHDRFAWPNNTLKGVVYIADIRVGDSCKNVPPVTPVCTIDNIPTQVQWTGAATYNITLSGISNGNGTTTGVTITPLSSKVAFIATPTLGTLGSDGKVTVTYSTLTANVDSSTLIFRVNCAGSIQKEMRFAVKSVSEAAANAVSVSIDAAVKGQTIVGFGGYAPKEYHLDEYVNDLRCTLMRISHFGGFESVNDNSDPAVLNKSKLNMSSIDFAYLKKAHDAGITDIYMTLFSPPVWMMQSLSDNAIEGAPAWAVTNQKVDPIYYDEYVEFMVAIVRIIKEESGLELAGFCPQNEPAYTEPYGSAILDPVHMATVCGMLGKRLSDEGYATKVINSEQNFNQGYQPVMAFITAVKADPLANQYTDIIGMHYPDANALLWNAQWNACKTGTYPKQLWAAETRAPGNIYDPKAGTTSTMEEMESMITGLNYGLSAWGGIDVSMGGTGNENDPNIVIGMMFGTNGGKSKHYWAFRNFSRFIRKGAVQLKTTVTGSANLKAASVMHEGDTTMTIVLLNKDTKLPLAVKLSGSAPTTGWDAYRTSYFEKCVKVDPFKEGILYLPPKSITTLTIKTNINHAPTADFVADVKLDKNAGTAVTINGIGCGDPVAQAMTVTATSSNPAILPNPTVNYTTPANKATLILMPVTDAIGEVTMTVIIKDDGGRANGGIDADTMTFKVSIGLAAINDVSDKVSLYPNPASDVVNLTVPAELANAGLVINNAAGQAMMERNLTGDQTTLEVSSLPAGTYFVSISNNGSQAKLMFVKK